MVRRCFLKGMAAVAIAALAALPGLWSQAGAQGPSQRALEKLKEVQARHTGALMARPGVVGTAIGYDRLGNLAIKVFLKTKAAAARIPKTLDGVPVSAEVTGEISALKKGSHGGGGRGKEKVDPTARFERPVPIGVSTGHPNITAGTIGCRVTDGNNLYALSNNHVYADENRATINDNVLQPGPYDGGEDPDDAIGTLYDFVPIDFDGGDNTIDAAIALSSTANLGNATPSDGYGVPKSTTVAPELGMRVMKYGRTTSLTKGRIYAVSATVDVTYDSGTARFVDQIVITPGSFSAGGDSGSLVVVQRGKDERKPVGLLFAGSSLVTIANPIGAVLKAFEVTIDGE